MIGHRSSARPPRFDKGHTVDRGQEVDAHRCHADLEDGASRAPARRAILPSVSNPSPRPTKNRLPELLRPFFWEHDFERLSWRADRDFIAERILTRGTWPAITWLRKRMGKAGLRDFLLASKGRTLTPRQLRFWQLILDLPEQEVSAWIDAKRGSVWFSRIREASP